MNNKAKIMAPVMSAVMILGMSGDIIAPNGLGLFTSQAVFAAEVNPAELDVGDFVKRCYEVALSRDADKEGFNYWVNMLNNGQACGAQVGYGFIFSDEYANKNTDNTQFVKDMYQMFFGREPDEEGFNYWLNLLNEGKARDSIFAGFANSTEFYNLCDKYGVVAGYYVEGVLNEQQGGVNCFVARLYKSCLGRLPDQAGQIGWVKKLTDKEETGASTAEKFIFSAELENRQLSNEDLVKVMYDAFFGREADPEGLAAWKDKLDNGASKNLIFKGFAESAEFDNLCNSYGIERGNIYNEGVQIAQGSEDYIGGTDAMINYFVDNVLNKNQDDNGVVTYISEAHYYDKERLTYLTASYINEALSFYYAADGESRTGVVFDFYRDSTWVGVTISIPFTNSKNQTYASPLYIACDIKNVDEIIAHITDPDYVLSNGSKVSDYVKYVPEFEKEIKQKTEIKKNIDLTYASFVKAFDEGLKYWGTSKETYDLTFGSDYSNYPTTGYTDYDYRNGLISYADSGMNWVDYMKYATKFLSVASFGENPYSNGNYSFYGPSYNPTDVWNIVDMEVNEANDLFSISYSGNCFKVSDDCNIYCKIRFDGKGEITFSFEVAYDYVQDDEQSAFKANNITSIYITSCKPEELMSIISSPETLKNSQKCEFDYYGDKAIKENEILNIFFSEIEPIMKNFEYTFNYCGTSFKDAGIDF